MICGSCRGNNYEICTSENLPMKVSGDRSRSGVLERIGNVLFLPLTSRRRSVRIKAGGCCHSSVRSISPPAPHPASSTVPPPPKELWNSTFRSTPPGAWAAPSRSFPSDPSYPSPNNSPLNHLPVRPDNSSPPLHLPLTIFSLLQPQSRPTRSLPLFVKRKPLREARVVWSTAPAV